MDEVKTLYNLITESKKIVVITGAGISTLSGIRDFKSIETENKTEKQILSLTTLKQNPELIFDFIKNNYIRNLQPNICHKFLSTLQEQKPTTIITMNIDGLHLKDNNHKVIEYHGNAGNWHCQECNSNYNLSDIAKMDYPICNICGNAIRPNIVLYGEHVNQERIAFAVSEIQSADLLIAMGTRVKTQDIEFLINSFNGEHKVLINNDNVNLEKDFTLKIKEDLGKVSQDLSQNLFKSIKK